MLYKDHESCISIAHFCLIRFEYLVHGLSRLSSQRWKKCRPTYRYLLCKNWQRTCLQSQSSWQYRNKCLSEDSYQRILKEGTEPRQCKYFVRKNGAHNVNARIPQNRSTVAQYVVDRSPRERRASVTLGEGISGEGSLPPIRDVLGGMWHTVSFYFSE